MQGGLWLHTGLSWAIDFIYPRCCCWCRCLLPDQTSRQDRFCLACMRIVAPEITDRCQRCSAPVGPHLETSRGCLHCKRQTRRYRDAISLGPYADELRHACLICKRSRHSTLASALSDLLCSRHGDLMRNWKCDVVMPVPHHWFDRILRDHPASIMAERISRNLHLPLERQTLRKVRRTRKQQELSASAREGNLKKAFRVTWKSHLKGKRILLVDDVLTTGITADRCTRVLMDAGATEVHVAVLARSISG